MLRFFESRGVYVGDIRTEQDKKEQYAEQNAFVTRVLAEEFDEDD